MAQLSLIMHKFSLLHFYASLAGKRRPTPRRLSFKDNNLHCNTTMKLSPVMKSLATVFQIPVMSVNNSVMRLAKPFVGQTQLTHLISPFSTTAKPQARESKRPRKDPRISPSPPVPSLLSTKLITSRQP